MRLEHEYERGGALAYLSAWDVCPPRQALGPLRFLKTESSRSVV
jgi:hypothetical protein